MSTDFSLFTSLRYDVNLEKIPSMGIQYAGWNCRNQSPLYMLDLHRDRLLRAAIHWNWERAVEKLSGEEGLQNLIKASQDVIGTAEMSPLRLRLVMDARGEIAVQRFDAQALEIGNLFPETLPAPGKRPGTDQPQVPPRLTVVVDHIGSSRSELTHFKTTHRAVYDDARSRAGLGSVSPADSTEVLLVNHEDDSIMEGSTTTPYFWRRGRWITPPVSSHFTRNEGSGGNDGTSRRWALERGLAVEQEIKANELVDGEDCYISNGVNGFRAGTVRVKRRIQGQSLDGHDAE